MAALLAGALLGQPAHAATEGASGIGDRYFPLDGNGGIDVRRYEISNAYDFATGELSGRTVVRLAATQDLTRFNLDLLLPVRAVRVDGRPARFWKPVQHELTISPATPLLRGDVVDVEVVYAGRPRRLSYAGESNWLAADGEIAAVNQPHMAPWWFPANDHPSDRAIVDLRMRVPHDRQVVSNGHLRGVTRGATSSMWHWRADEPMAAYLAFVTAGRFRLERTRTPLGPAVYAVSRRLRTAEQDAALRQLRRSAQVAADLSAAIGSRYPFSTIGGVSSGVLSGFALENQTRPVYPAFGLGQGLMAHELAHQWFGDKVTLARWSDIWLNEGFATWFEHVVVSGEGGASRWLRSVYDQTPADDWFWGVTPGDPGRDNLFGRAVYVRGAMTLMALRQRIGDEAFDEVIRRWADRSGPASTEQLVALAESVSGQDLTELFDAWLFTAGKPAAIAEHGL